MSQRGFTIIELLIVVGMVVILTMLLNESYGRYRARARQGEAKTALAALYTTEQAYAAQSGSYSMCLIDIGYQRPGTSFYYAVGWGWAYGNGDCGPTGDGNCDRTWEKGAREELPCSTGSPEVTAPYAHTLNANLKVDASSHAATYLDIFGALPADCGVYSGGCMTRHAFVAGAAGNISTSIVSMDQWTIRQDKVLLNTISSL